ncbi:hypothetical protein [Cyclobacterium plantarum]|uniref:DUF1735 domain-containing protein n=1 Tax=Cyclobacterium plantarum TaxID=2716263 RepID=A0ABX0H9B0_9BACT|nr:hypothetical protein [Cyclobacterium plantarum]NHE58484.1 hypothetical protein [Cyclobacterium plantarum]
MNMQLWRISSFLTYFGLFVACQENTDALIPNNEIIELIILDPSSETELFETLGDGEASIMLKVQIPHNAADKYKSVKFTASDGKFINDSGEYIKRTNSEGIAVSYLTVPLKSGPLYLSAQIGENTDIFYDEKIINLVDIGNILEFEILDNSFQHIPSNMKADGTTILSLKVTANHFVNNLGSIEFSVSDGEFIGSASSSIAFNTDKEAITKFKLPQTPGDIYFTAKSSENSSIQQNAGIKLERAYPDHILLEPSSLFVTETDNTINIVTYLLRNEGSVSIGTRAEFQAFQIDSNNQEKTVGRFTGLTEAVTDEKGKISSVNFLADTGDIDFDNPIFIKAFTTNDTGDVIEEILAINN